MALQDINIGTVPNDGTGERLKDAFNKINLNFDELYSSWFSLVLGKTSVTETTITGGVVQTFSYSGTTEKRYRFIGSPYDSATDIIYTTFSGGVLSNPVAYKLITL